MLLCPIQVLRGPGFLRNEWSAPGRLAREGDAYGLRRIPRLLEQYAPVALECDRYTEREPHLPGQEAFLMRCRLPWHRQPHVRIMVEITADEPVLRPVRQRRITHEYGEPLKASIGVYSLEEIVAEKLRAILRQAKA